MATSPFSVAPWRRLSTFTILDIDFRRADHVVRAKLDSVVPIRQEVEPGEITPSEVLQKLIASLDRLARDLALSNWTRSLYNFT